MEISTGLRAEIKFEEHLIEVRCFQCELWVKPIGDSRMNYLCVTESYLGNYISNVNFTWLRNCILIVQQFCLCMDNAMDLLFYSVELSQP